MVIVEVVHTSAPHGLHDRHGGFTVVAATRGATAPVIDAIATLSAYTFPPLQTTPPILWSLRRLRAGSGTWSVLSRIGACGTDHTGRRNRIAHHLALDEEARRLAEPADWLAGHPFLVEWDGPPRELEPPMIPGPATGPPEHWEEELGDRRWIDAIGTRLDLLRGSCVTVLLPGGTDPQRVAAAVLRRRETAAAWSIGFSTRPERSSGDDGVRLRLLSEDDVTWPRASIRPGPATIDLRGRPACPEPAEPAEPSRTAVRRETVASDASRPRPVEPPPPLQPVPQPDPPPMVPADADGNVPEAMVEYVDRRHGLRVAVATFLLSILVGVASTAVLDRTGLLGFLP